MQPNIHAIKETLFIKKVRNPKSFLDFLVHNEMAEKETTLLKIKIESTLKYAILNVLPYELAS